MTRRARFTLLLSLCLSPLAWGASYGAPPVLGCSNCPPHQPIQEFKGGHVTPGGFFETGAPDEPMLPFFGGYAYEIKHGLGSIPKTVTPYLAFVERPYEQPKDSGLAHVALVAGNLALFERWDDEAVIVRNDSCSDFYLRVVIEAGPGGLGGQGGAVTE
jgi:hypothetical protein